MKFLGALQSATGAAIAIFAIAAIVVGGALYVQFGLGQVRDSSVGVQSQELRGTFETMAELHNLALAVQEARRLAASDASGATAPIIRAVDELFVRAEDFAGRLRRTQTPAAMNLLEAVRRIIERTDLFFVNQQRDLDAFADEIDELLHNANQQLFFFVNERYEAQRASLTTKAAWLEHLGLIIVLVLLVLGLISSFAVVLLRTEVRSRIERVEAEARARYLAYHDGLTGLANRTRFNEETMKLFGERLDAADDAAPTQSRLAEDGGGERVALLLMDLDKFKLVNDTHGHDVGDALLKAVGARIEGAVTQAGGLVARLGGDEFAALIPRGASQSAITALCEAIMAAVRAPLSTNGLELHPRTTIGAAIGDPAKDSRSALMKAADLALYKAKSEGRDTYAFFDEALAQAEEERRILLGDLESAVIEDDFFLLFEPQASADNKQIVGFEALPRWRRRGVVTTPSVFQDVADAAGRMMEIDAWRLRTATREVAAWMADGAPPTHLSVAISGRLLGKPATPDIVRDALKSSGLPATLLTLEIAEDDFATQSSIVADVVEAIRSLGVKFALSKFGAGHLSFKNFSLLRPDILKLDRSFLVEFEAPRASTSILGAFFDLASGLEVELMIDGVETEDQHGLLHEIGCSYAQGPFYGEAKLGPEARHMQLASMASQAKLKTLGRREPAT